MNILSNDTTYPVNGFKTPVLFLTYCRPETTILVFNVIRQIKPEKLYLAQNTPDRDDFENNKKWHVVRKLIESVDWNCEVHRLYHNEHLDIKSSICSSITWFFENEEMGIILEDDCVPDISFFQFCQELLEKYKDDDRIAMISGNNFQFGRKVDNYSYYFSRYTHIWGWASWRRAWKNYDPNMMLWPEIRSNHLLRYYLTKRSIYQYWKKIFDKCYKNDILTWDYQWLFMSWIQNQLTILPCKNLVTNIGFGPEAVHTKGKSGLSNMKTEKMIFPLIHPEYIMPNMEADLYTEKKQFSGGNILLKLLKKIKQLYFSLGNN